MGPLRGSDTNTRRTLSRPFFDGKLRNFVRMCIFHPNEDRGPKNNFKWVKTHIEGSHDPNRPRLDGPTTVPAGPKGLPARSEGPDILTSK